MSAAHEVWVDVPDTATTADARRLLDYLDQHAPETAALKAAPGKIGVQWTGDPTAAPTRNTTTAIGFGVQPADQLAYGRSPGQIGGDR